VVRQRYVLDEAALREDTRDLKMPATFTKGDLFGTDGLHAYALATNARGTMDRGVAVAFKKRWPNLATELSTRAKAGLTLGEVVAFSEGESTVYALVLQEDEAKKAKLATLSRAVNKLVELAAQSGIAQVGLFHPGTGKAGLDWPRVKGILQEIGARTEVTLVVFEQFVRAKPSE
jgi:O-acetyl-ADP-ribose deacetylase (regulator of RNase III)